jgi:AAA15 family ATPase/GTPase
VAIISLRSLLRFIFNPYGVGASGAHFPQVSPVAIHIQPLRGWRIFDAFTTGFTCGYYLAPLVTTFHIQPLRGWHINDQGKRKFAMLESLYIKNFRIFKELKFERVGRVNLIVGQNNAGKTALLEALAVYASHAAFAVLKKSVFDRQEYWESGAAEDSESESNVLEKHPYRYLFYNYNFPKAGEEGIEIGPVDAKPDRLKLSLSTAPYTYQVNSVVIPKEVPALKLEKNADTRYILLVNPPSKEHFSSQGSSLKEINSQFVATQPMDATEMEALWDYIFLTPLEAFVTQGVQLLDNRIQRIGLIRHFLKQGSINRLQIIPIVVRGNERLPLKNLGEGITRVFQIILSLVNARDGFLLIDEFENGLHYSVQPKVWELVFKLAQELNVQVFATTHSKDCVDGFQTAWETQEEQGSFYRLNHRPEKGVVATLYDCETLSDTLEMDGEMR